MNENFYKNDNGTLNIDLVCERWIADKFHLVLNDKSGELVIKGDFKKYQEKGLRKFGHQYLKIPIVQKEIQELIRKLNLVLLKIDNVYFYYSLEFLRKRLAKLETDKTYLEISIKDNIQELNSLREELKKVDESLIAYKETLEKLRE